MSESKFSLIGVWRLRKVERDECRLAVAEVLASHERVAAELARAGAQIEQIQARRRQATAPGVLRLEWLQDELHNEQLLRQDRQRYLDEAAQLAAELERRQADLAAAESQWRAIQWLRERATTAAGAPLHDTLLGDQGVIECRLQRVGPPGRAVLRGYSP